VNINLFVNDSVIILDYVLSNGRMSDELKKIWNEMVVTKLMYYPGIFLAVPRKTMNNWSE
jgi:hypothetical protein